MKTESEKLKRFIDDAAFLEKNKLQIECELNALKKKIEKESERSQYCFSEKTEKLSGVILIAIIYVIVMLLVHFIIVPLMHFVIIDLIVSLFQGFRTMPPYKIFDVVCDIIIGTLLFIPVLASLIDFIKEKMITKRERKEKVLYDENEEQRLQHFNNVILPKIKDEKNKLEKEYNIYDSEIQQLYELNVIPIEYCNLEAMYVMQKYILKYKIIDKKKLLNACDKYFQYKDLKQGVKNAQERLDDAQMKIIHSFEEMAYSMESQMELLAMKIESQNYDLEQLHELTEREKCNSELLLYWHLIE